MAGLNDIDKNRFHTAYETFYRNNHQNKAHQTHHHIITGFPYYINQTSR